MGVERLGENQELQVRFFFLKEPVIENPVQIDFI